MISTIGIYFHMISLVCLSCFGMLRLFYFFTWKRIKDVEEGVPEDISIDGIECPKVTVQLPIYNEKYVAKRVIEAACSLEWPRDRLEIQVLDDSNDVTKKIVDATARRLKDEGHPVYVIRRKARTGYKAGALALGCEKAKGEFFAIFDADFVPEKDFLKKTMPAFKDPRVGMVQARWGFLNEGHSILTRIQAIFLRFHFKVEHGVRHALGLLLNFNGTAGIWRREAIEDAGGWQSDTVTEDLDLSIRAQLKGWKMRYLTWVVVDSELPVTLSALRSQQNRWAKGSMQTFRKMFGPILTSSSLSLIQKFHGFFLLLANVGWIIGISAFLSFYFVLDGGTSKITSMGLTLSMLSYGSILSPFLMTELILGEKRFCEILVALCVMPIIGVALAPSIALSALMGLLSKGGEFSRTPKFGVVGKGRTTGKTSYHSVKLMPLVTDFCLFFYCILVFQVSKVMGYISSILFVSLLGSGLLWILMREINEFLLTVNRATKGSRLK